MVSLDISFGIKNLLKRPIQTGLLFFSVLIMSAVLFGGIVIGQSLEQGMTNMSKRLGADLMIVPAQAKGAAEDVLLEGARDYTYFDRKVYDDIIGVYGVREATAQMFLKSLTADCCSSEVQIVLFDPESDFLITPWIKEKYSKSLTMGMAVVGSSVNIEENNKIRLFGTEYNVAARMDRTGTTMDQSVYFVFETLPMLISDARDKGAYILENQDDVDIISTIFVNLEEDSKVSKVVQKIDLAVKEDIAFVYPKELADTMSINLLGIYSIIRSVLILFVVILMIIMFIVYLTSANDRKREISLFRILGASQRDTVYMLVKEASIISFLGGIAGCALSVLLVIPFGNYIGMKIGMSYLGPDFIKVVILYLAVMLTVFIVGILASIYPAIHISIMDPYYALRKEGE